MKVAKEQFVGVTYDELIAENAKLWELVAQRTAKRVIVSNSDTDHATGHCECSACGCHVSPIARYCEGCGAYFINNETEETE